MTAKADGSAHEACVDRWWRRVARGMSPDAQVAAFSTAFAALWKRAQKPLGEVTLTAIVDRVLYTAVQQYPALSMLRVDRAGLSCDELGAASPGIPEAELTAGLRFLLVEFLTVLGNLTAEILTPHLHAQLAAQKPSEDLKT